MKKTHRFVIWRSVILAAFVACTMSPDSAHAQGWVQIDPYGSDDRYIPDIKGNYPDSILLDDSMIIDVIVLGDGFIKDTVTNDSLEFLDDARDRFYYRLFGGGGFDGMRPFTLFPQAFRVRANYTPGTDRASADPDSYYRISVDSAGSNLTGDFKDDTANADQLWFHQKLYESIDDAPGPLNLATYPASIAGAYDSLTYKMHNRYRNLIVVMLVRSRDSVSNDTNKRPTGFVSAIRRLGDSVKVRMGAGKTEFHEFSHAFGYVRDEYYDNYLSVATWSNAPVAQRSVFNMSNLNYSLNRCDFPWSHLAPGGTYNPKLYSLIGNLFRGGRRDSLVWHSEYQCLMNGTHDNRYCDISPPPQDTATLRNSSSLCYWCQEVETVRIFEITRQFDPPVSSDWTDIGQEWYLQWANNYRADYYNYFTLRDTIANQNQCFSMHFTGEPCSSCSGDECDTTVFLRSGATRDTVGLPDCLFGCDIRELGNVIYVDGDNGNLGALGSKYLPVLGIQEGVQRAGLVCNGAPIVVLLPATYGGAITISDPVTLIADGCEATLVGKR